VSGFLACTASPEEYLSDIARTAGEYDDFNLIVADGSVCASLSSRDRTPGILQPGIYGLSNHVLNTPWPKVVRAVTAFSELLATRPQPSKLFAMLADSTPAPDFELPQTGVSLEWERKLSSIFIASPGYGTRASTVVLFGRNGDIRFHERSFRENGEPLGEVEYKITR
jgi:uncharacterized protein with NRDE domain